jgi:hypothetical protein
MDVDYSPAALREYTAYDDSDMAEFRTELEELDSSRAGKNDASKRGNIMDVTVQEMASQNPIFTSYAEMIRNKNKNKTSFSQIKPPRRTRPL